MPKPVVWMASTKDDLKEMPDDVQDEIGFALERVQAGKTPANVSPLHGDLAGVCEIKADDASGTYRLMYTTKLGDVVYALDAFQKKSKKGIATPKRDLERVAARLKQAREHYEQSKKRQDG